MLAKCSFIVIQIALEFYVQLHTITENIQKISIYLNCFPNALLTCLLLLNLVFLIVVILVFDLFIFFYIIV